MTKKQLNLLKVVNKNPNSNTHQLNEILGNYQPYESHLRDRLVRLIPYVTNKEIKSNKGYVKSRTWFITDQGINLLNQNSK